MLCIGMDPLSQLRGPMAWITAHHKARSWAFVGNDYIWPRRVHTVASRIVAALGGRVVLDRRVPRGALRASVDQVIEELRHSRADAVLLSLDRPRPCDVQHRAEALWPRPEPCPSLPCAGGERPDGRRRGPQRSPLCVPCRRSPPSMTIGDSISCERHRAVLGPDAPVLDAYAEGVYDGVRLVTLLAGEHALTPSGGEPASHGQHRPLVATAHLARGGRFGLRASCPEGPFRLETICPRLLAPSPGGRDEESRR